jgi:regulator of sigma E protease
MSDFVLAIIAFLVVIGPLILIHELGHYLAARLVGVTVLEFGIGFPPRAVKLFERGGTEFTLNWLPIGGFVRPLGEDFVKPLGENATEAERQDFEARMAERTHLEARNIKTKSLMEANPWQRIIFMSAGIVFNIIAGAILFFIMAVTGIPQLQSATVSVLGIAPNSPAAKAGVQAGDVLITLNGVKIQTSQDIDDEIGNRIAKDIDLEVKRGDQIVKMTVSPAQEPIVADGRVLVTEIAAGSPAAGAGIKIGDYIVKIDDTAITSQDTLLAYNRQKAGQEVTITLERAGQPLTVKLTPRKDPPAGQGPIGTVIATLKPDPAYGLSLIDLNQVTKVIPLSVGDAARYALTRTNETLGLVLGAPIQLIAGRLKPEEARPASIVGISQMGAAVIQQSSDRGQLYPILSFAAVISIAIGITQILPIPGLDGGRIIFVIFELLRGKPINQEREGMVHLIGLIVLLGLMAVFVVNDIVNPLVLPR